MISSVEIQKDGVLFVVTRNEDGGPHRRPINPGHIESGKYVPTDTSGEPPMVKAAADHAWTPDVVAAWQQRCEDQAKALEAEAAAAAAKEQEAVDAQARLDVQKARASQKEMLKTLIAEVLSEQAAKGK